MNRSDGLRRSTGPGVTCRLGTVIVLLSRVSFVKYAEKTFPPVAAAEYFTGSSLLGCATVTTSMQVTSRQVTAVAAARGPATELELVIDPPAGFHIPTEGLQLQKWNCLQGVYNIIHDLEPAHSWNYFFCVLYVSVRTASLRYSKLIEPTSGQSNDIVSQWPA